MSTFGQPIREGVEEYFFIQISIYNNKEIYRGSLEDALRESFYGRSSDRHFFSLLVTLLSFSRKIIRNFFNEKIGDIEKSFKGKIGEIKKIQEKNWRLGEKKFFQGKFWGDRKKMEDKIL